MQKIKINLKRSPDRSYSINLESGLFERIPGFLHKNNFAGKYAVISDSNVSEIYGGRLVANLEKSGIPSVLFTYKAGEPSKNISTAEKLLNGLISKGFTRKDGIIALGGGITGDIAGFVASVFMRGIPFVQVPTSLLAMVDSSIGGKTGVNLAGGKNLCGTFYQPKAVLIDPGLLKTLPKEELTNGFAEIIKYGVIANDKLFRLLEKERNKVLSLDAEILNKIIIQCCKIKASITEMDEQESGLRMILNYGHTAGHAIEKLASYKISHGRAIAIGMKIINRIAVNLHMLSKNNDLRINNLLKSYRLDDNLLEIFGTGNSCHKLWSIMQKDKKMRKSKISFIIPIAIGKTRIYDGVTEKIFLKSFDNMSK